MSKEKEKEMETLRVQLTAFEDRKFPVYDSEKEVEIDGEWMTVTEYDIRYSDSLSDHDVDAIIHTMFTHYTAEPVNKKAKRPHIFRSWAD